MKSTLVQIHRVSHSRKSIQIERFLYAISKIRATIRRSHSVDNFIDLANSEDLRGSYFAIQDLFRYYSKIGYGKEMRKWFVSIHNLQRQIGAYSDEVDFVEIAKKVHADPRALQIKYRDLAAHKKLLAKRLISGGWYPTSLKNKSKYDSMVTFLHQCKWHDEHQDALDILKVMIKSLKKIELNHYDFSRLEGNHGIHEYRRDIRRTPAILSLATHGLFQLNKNLYRSKLNKYLTLNQRPIAKAVYNQLPRNPYTKYVVIIPQHYYLAVSQLIDDLGRVKKMGQTISMLADAYCRANIAGSNIQAQSQVKRLLRKTYSASQINYRKSAQQIYNTVVQTKLIKEYRHVLKEARRELKIQFN